METALIITLIIGIVTIIITVITLVLLIQTRHTVSEMGRDNILPDVDRRLSDLQIAVIREISDGQARDAQALREGLIDLWENTDRRLSQIQGNVNEKLDRSLNERLDENFRQVGERLESLYKSLGELKNLETGVTSLNKTLSNVKSRGVYGEMQLGNILANILDKSQYEANVASKLNASDFVEYAVKIPDKDNKGGFIYLPVDSKFPADIYGKIADAERDADAAALKAARKELKDRIRSEAMSIRDKYVAPPYTTDFAVMFLPTESLYAEVLRIDGLAEECQTKYKIVIAGPMTLTAMINSLSVGFRYLTVNKKTDEILKTLSAFKTQFEKFDDLIGQTQKSLEAAQKKTEKLHDRNRLIRDKLKKVESLDYDESMELIADSEDGYYFDSGEEETFE